METINWDKRCFSAEFLGVIRGAVQSRIWWLDNEIMELKYPDTYPRARSKMHDDAWISELQQRSNKLKEFLEEIYVIPACENIFISPDISPFGD